MLLRHSLYFLVTITFFSEVSGQSFALDSEIQRNRLDTSKYFELLMKLEGFPRNPNDPNFEMEYSIRRRDTVLVVEMPSKIIYTSPSIYLTIDKLSKRIRLVSLTQGSTNKLKIPNKVLEGLVNIDVGEMYSVDSLFKMVNSTGEIRHYYYLDSGYTMERVDYYFNSNKGLFQKIVFTYNNEEGQRYESLEWNLVSAVFGVDAAEYNELFSLKTYLKQRENSKEFTPSDNFRGFQFIRSPRTKNP